MTKKTFVLVGDEQLALSPKDVAAMVTHQGFKATAAKTGFSETTLRVFLSDNGFVAHKHVVYEKTIRYPQETPLDDETRPTARPDQLPSDPRREGSVASEGPDAA